MTQKKPVDWHIEYVERGDTWERIATQHGISIDLLQKQNNVTNRNDALHVGQPLLVPGK